MTQPESEEKEDVLLSVDYEEDLALKRAEEALSLEEREARWGFSLPELQTTSKVVSILFKNPSLFVSDPYLAESRLYTMITRDRKTKRENREVYKKIMSEEKSRRRRYQRFQDVEAVRKTTMKREREEALQSLLLPPPLSASTIPLVVCDERGNAEERGQGMLYSLPGRQRGEQGGEEGITQNSLGIESVKKRKTEEDIRAPFPEMTTTPKVVSTEGIPLAVESTLLASSPSSWSEVDRTIFRMVGAFENICRLEAVQGGVPSSSSGFTRTPTATSRAGGGLHCESECRTRSPQAQNMEEGNAPATHDGKCRQPSSTPNASSGTSLTSPLPTRKAVTWWGRSTEVAVAISQLTAQVYRYIPHAYGTQMPPPLFSGPLPRRRAPLSSTPSSAGVSGSQDKRTVVLSSIFSFVDDNIPPEHQSYAVAWELCIARVLLKLVPLKPIPLPSGTSFSLCGGDKSEGATEEEHVATDTQTGLQAFPTAATVHPAFLTGEDVVVCGAPLPTYAVSSSCSFPSTTAMEHQQLSGGVVEDVVWLYRYWMSWLFQWEGDSAMKGRKGMEDETLWNPSSPSRTSGQHQSVRTSNPSPTAAAVACVEVMQRWCNSSARLISAPCSAETLLDELEALLLDGREESSREEEQRTSVFFEFLLEDVEDALSPVEAALATLRLFLLRRIYGLSSVRHFPPSPIVIDTKPPISDDVEPDVYNIYDDLQVYSNETTPEEHLKVSKLASCYTCKVRYQILHPYYYSMCHLCGEYNYNKRLMTADLRGKNVLLTGCRIKIGFMMALSLLRCGARLLGTTRFAHEALTRFRAEPDYPLWKDRLHLFSLDLRDMWMTTQFCFFIRTYFGGKLYAIINNAAQTIARTPEYTLSLRALEQCPPPDLQAGFSEDKRAMEWHHFFCRHTTIRIGVPLALDTEHVKLEAGMTAKTSEKTTLHRITAAPFESSTAPTFSAWDGPMDEAKENSAGTPELLSIDISKSANTTNRDDTSSALQSEETTVNAMSSQHDNRTNSGEDGAVILGQFDRYDTFAEESDLREKNSWVMNLAEVSGGEAAEVMAINALSPFIINAKLKPCLLNREGEEISPLLPPEPRFIINVSAMEGQFYRYKQTTHPHTNMAKAALNMMSRTSGEDYAADGIYMNSVDTGWITDESPKNKKERRTDQLLLCPLDEVDAAARCLDLVYMKSREYGKFYKDFKEIPW